MAESQAEVSGMRRITASTVVAAVLAGIPSAIYGPTSAAPARTLRRHVVRIQLPGAGQRARGRRDRAAGQSRKKAHQLTFARLDDTSSLDRVMRSLVADKVRTGGIRWVGGVESAMPGESERDRCSR